MDRQILVTGATGKVGQHFIARLLADENFAGDRVRAICHSRTLPETDRVSVARGSIADRQVVRRALDGITHVVHLATCKETPEDVMDVTVMMLPAIVASSWLVASPLRKRCSRNFACSGHSPLPPK